MGCNITKGVSERCIARLLLTLGQNARVGVLVLTSNVNSVTDLHNQRDSYLNDLDWDRPPLNKLCIQRKCLSGHTHNYMVT